MRKGIVVTSLISIVCMVSCAQAEVVGLWEFNDAGNLTLATVGSDLILNGAGQSAIGGGDGSDGAVAVQPGTYYQCAHGIAANGGSAGWVNEYTLLFDVMYPQASEGKWRAFYQTGYATYNDSDYFIRPGDDSWGVSALGYTDNATVGEWYSSHSTWYRVVMTVNLDDNSAAAFYNMYINGALKGSHNTGNLGLDGRFALYPSSHANPYVCFAGDDNGEDALMYFSNIAIWNRPLTAQEVAELGGPGDPILGNHPGVRVTESDGTTAVKEGEGTDTYEVVLRSAPSANVVVRATPDDDQIDLGSGPGKSVALRFTPQDWDVQQSVHIQAIDDDVYEGKEFHTTTINHTAVSEDEGYDSIAIVSVAVRVSDNELTCGDWGFLRSDLNKDCYVNFLDFALFADLWLER